MICRELQECRADEIYNCKNKKRCVIVGNGFWERIGFAVRDDLVYRNKNIHEFVRMDT